MAILAFPLAMHARNFEAARHDSLTINNLQWPASVPRHHITVSDLFRGVDFYGRRNVELVVLWQLTAEYHQGYSL